MARREILFEMPAVLNFGVAAAKPNCQSIY